VERKGGLLVEVLPGEESCLDHFRQVAEDLPGPGPLLGPLNALILCEEFHRLRRKVLVLGNVEECHRGSSRRSRRERCRKLPRSVRPDKRLPSYAVQPPSTGMPAPVT